MILTKKILRNFSLQSGRLFVWEKNKPQQINLP